jgi:hypothetical protein
MEKTSTSKTSSSCWLLEPSPQIATSAGVLFRHTVSALDFRQEAARRGDPQAQDPVPG